MNLLARARRFFALTAGRGAGRGQHDPADMGTAFGLDAVSVLEPESAEEIALRKQTLPSTRFEHRLNRRSSY